jgi:CubicO group peptidase (beta-lactamase class C family)
MMSSRVRRLAVCESAAVLCLWATLSAHSGQSPPEQRASEIASLLQQWGAGEAASYIDRSYAPALLEQSGPSAQLTFLGQLRDRTGKAEIDSLRLLSDGRAEAWLRDPDNDWVTVLRVATEPAPPHRITAVELGPTHAPPRVREAGFTAADAAHEARRLVRSFCERDAFSGSVLLELAGRVVLEESCGEAHKDFGVLNNAATRFNIASLPKMFAGVAIARLVQEGRVAFSDPVSKFLPDFPTREGAAQIRVEHLLTHTSGIGNVFSASYVEGSPLRSRELDALLALAAGDSLRVREPGTAWAYSNTGYLVLGRIIEEASGMRYEDFIARAIFDPAGMTQTCLCSLDRVNHNLAVGYIKEFSPAGVAYQSTYFLENIIQGSAAGGAYSTVTDLLRFGRALRSGGLIAPELVEIVTSGKPELESAEYGYGFGILEPGKVVAHSGGTYGASANLEIGLGGQYTLAMLSNYSGGAAFPLVLRLRTIAAQAAAADE